MTISLKANAAGTQGEILLNGTPVQTFNQNLQTFSGTVESKGSGFKFPNPAVLTNDPSTLDKYFESGDYTVPFSAATGAFSNADGLGQYIRIGRLCVFTCWIEIIAKGTAAGGLLVTLPFTSAHEAAGSGNETALNGTAETFRIGNGAFIASVAKYDGSSVIADGTKHFLTMSYIVAEGQ